MKTALRFCLWSLLILATHGALARTIVVLSTADNGPGSLREALALAVNGDTINITANGTITLTSGELVVSKDLAIHGPGSHGSISGNNASRVFHVVPGTKVTIDSLVITSGKVSIAQGAFAANAGGAIYIDHGKVTISHCVISSSTARFGGGIFNLSDDGTQTPVAISDSTINNNSAARSGGGIYNAGGGAAFMSVTNSTVSNNAASFGGGAIYNDGENGGNAIAQLTNVALIDNSAGVVGGGIHNDAEFGNANLALDSCVVSGNSAGADVAPANARGAGGIFNDGYVGNAILTVKNSSINGNRALYADSPGNGGGIYNYAVSGTAAANVVGCTINENSTPLYGQGGAIYNHSLYSGAANLFVTKSAINNNSTGGSGGGVENFSELEGSATMTLTDSTLRGNSAIFGGGGIFNDAETGTATMALIDSAVTGNSGGGIYNFGISGAAALTITNSTVSGNSDKSAGGIFNEAEDGSATLTIVNSTVSGNSATDSSAGQTGGIINFGFGLNTQAIAVLALRNTTLSGNSAADVGGISNGIIGSATATVDIANTILNAGASGANIVNGGPIFPGQIISHGYNLSSDAAGGDGTNGPGGLLSGPGDIRNTNPLLGRLKDNGGPTMTHSLLKNSPAIDHGDPDFNPYLFNPPLLYDQRGPGFPRIVNGRVDIGAIEATRP